MAEQATVEVTVLYFGGARQMANRPSETIRLPVGSTVEQLRSMLAASHPGLKEIWRHVRWAVDSRYADPETVLQDGAEIALIPPVAGGAAPVRDDIRAELTESPLNAESLRRWAQRPDTGAVGLFVGAVRDHHQGREVSHLFYEAYPPMAMRLLHEIADAARSRFSLARIGVVHRLGRLEIGDAAVVVAASSAHRAAVFDAPRWVMDAIKADVPIFKHEFYADGSDIWVGLPDTTKESLP